MTAGLLFIVAGLIFTLTGVGIIIGMPLIVIGFLLMLSEFIGRFSPIAALVVIGIALAVVSSAKAAEPQRLVPRMLALHTCMQGHAGVRSDAVLNILRNGGNPLIFLTDKCPNESVAFVEACEQAGYDSRNCYKAVVGDAQDIVEAVAVAAQLAP